MKTLLLAIALLTASFVPHEFFTSICTLHHDPQERTLEITWRITTHDLEHALEPDAKGPLRLGGDNEASLADSLIAAYLLTHLTLSINGTPLSIKFLGRQVEMEDVYCFLEVDEVPEVNGLAVNCTLLQDLFLEQQNIVHLETPEAATSTHIFLRGDPTFTFILK